jgi:hypothetical protein
LNPKTDILFVEDESMAVVIIDDYNPMVASDELEE